MVAETGTVGASAQGSTPQEHIAFIVAVQGAETGAMGCRRFYTRDELARYLRGQQRYFTGRRHRQQAFNEAYRVNAEFYTVALSELEKTAKKSGLDEMQKRPWNISRMLTHYRKAKMVKTDDIVTPDERVQPEGPTMDLGFLDEGRERGVPRAVAARAQSMAPGSVADIGEE